MIATSTAATAIAGTASAIFRKCIDGAARGAKKKRGRKPSGYRPPLSYPPHEDAIHLLRRRHRLASPTLHRCVSSLVERTLQLPRRAASSPPSSRHVEATT